MARLRARVRAAESKAGLRLTPAQDAALNAEIEALIDSITATWSTLEAAVDQASLYAAGAGGHIGLALYDVALAQLALREELTEAQIQQGRARVTAAARVSERQPRE